MKKHSTGPSKKLKKAYFSSSLPMIARNLLLAVFGGGGYALIEFCFRGYTHWSMILTGAACMLTLYYLNLAVFSLPITLKAVLGSAVITLYELIIGSIVNLRFHYDVWDYSSQKLSLYGQICPLFSFLWFLLCFILAAFSFFFYNGKKIIQAKKHAAKETRKHESTEFEKIAERE